MINLFIKPEGEGDNNKETEVDLKEVPVEESTAEEVVKEDLDVDDEDELDLDKFPVRELKFYIPPFKEPMAFNPLVSLVAFLCLWGLAFWSMIDPDGSNTFLVDWRARVTLNFTWLFVGTKGIFFLFLVYVGFKYGHIKLGKNDEKPEFDTASYFAMIFAAGVAVGLFVFGVAEPLWHQSSHFFANAGYRSQDEIDMFAINLTVTNWAIAGWAPYLIVAVSMGLAGFRFNLPMTFRSCFYPILGDYTWGWIGDMLDASAIIVSVAGVCTSLGLGAITIVDGFKFLGWVDQDASEDRTTAVQNIVIWVVTGIATASVISGLNAGVKLLSQFAFLLGMLLLFAVFVMDDSKYLMNLIVQELGYFPQWSLFLLNFWTDAFGQLREGSGRAVDGNAAAVWWMDAWAIFYQAWWVSWSCFVGLFVARISRGRTIGQVILFSMVFPVLYCILWFCVWGGVGIRQARQALEIKELGATVFGDETYYQTADYPNCYDVPQDGVIVNGTRFFRNYLIGVTPVCEFDSSYSGFAPFFVLYSFSYPKDLDTGYGPFLTVLFLIGLAIYFATSSDSGSLIVDHLASNGRKKHHWLQRLFWAVTEGAVATALLASGGSSALRAVQAASIIAGLPFTLFLIYLMQTIHLFCEHAVKNYDTYEYEHPNKVLGKSFSMPVYGGIFNYGEVIASLGKYTNEKRRELGIHAPNMTQITGFFVGLIFPFLQLWRILEKTYPGQTVHNVINVVAYCTMYYAYVILFIVFAAVPALLPWGWVAFFSAGCHLGALRFDFRRKFNIRSNMLADLLCGIWFSSQVLTQMSITCDELDVAGIEVGDVQLEEKEE